MVEYLCDGIPSRLSEIDYWTFYEVMKRIDERILLRRKREQQEKQRNGSRTSRN